MTYLLWSQSPKMRSFHDCHASERRMCVCPEMKHAFNLEGRYIPLHTLSNGRKHKNTNKKQVCWFFCVFFERKKTSLPWNLPFSKKFRCLSHGPSSEFSPRTAAPSAGGPGGLGRENPNGATSTFGPSGACKKKGQERWIVTWSKYVEVFVDVRWGCCTFSVVFFEYRIATGWSRVFGIVVCPPSGEEDLVIWGDAGQAVDLVPSQVSIHFNKMGFVQLKVSWIRRFPTSLASFDFSVFSLFANMYLRMLQVSERLWLDKNLLNWS